MFLGQGKKITKRGSTLTLPLCEGWVAPPRLSSLGDAAPGVSSASPLPGVAQDCRKLSLLRRKSLKRQTSSSGGGGASPRYREVWKSRVPAKFSSPENFYLIRTTEEKKKKERKIRLLTHSLPKTALAQGIFPALGSVAKFELALEVSLTNYWISWFCVRT